MPPLSASLNPRLRTFLTILTLTTITLTSLSTFTLALRSRVQNRYDLSQHAARMDSMERSLRDQIGYIGQALDRLDGAAKGTKAWGGEGRTERNLLGLYEPRRGKSE